MNITINIVELASELATEKLHDNWAESIRIYEDEDAEELVYTEEAQDVFNEYYDQYYSLIDNLQIKNA